MDNTKKEINQPLQTQEPENKISRWLHNMANIFNIVLVLVTSTYAYITYEQMKIMNLSLDETKVSRELEYKAYVGIKDCILIKHPDNSSLADLNIKFINTGRTPGLDGKIRVKVEARETPVPEQSDISLKDDAVISKLVLFPQVEYTNKAGTLETNEAHSLLTKQPKVIVESRKNYVYGVIEYSDIFNKPHKTRFCYQNIPLTAEWNLCPTFNDAN